MTTGPNRTGYRGIDRILDIAEARGLIATIEDHRGDGSFVVATITNAGVASENGLNDETITLYASFSRSKRGRFWGGYRYPLLGAPFEFNRNDASGSIRDARFYVEQMYVRKDLRTQYDADREARAQQEHR